VVTEGNEIISVGEGDHSLAIILWHWEQVLEHTTANNHPTPPLQQLLTPREYEVFVLAAHGLTNNEIAAKLCVSVSTVKTHLINIHAKLNIKRRTDVVHLATQYRIQP